MIRHLRRTRRREAAALAAARRTGLTSEGPQAQHPRITRTQGHPANTGRTGEELPKVMYSLIDAEAYRNASALVVGGGDSAVEAAMGLAYQKGNQGTLSYRGTTFHRIKDRNQRQIQQAIASGRLRVLFNSQVVEVRSRTVVLRVGGAHQELENDYVWVFVGRVLAGRIPAEDRDPVRSP